MRVRETIKSKSLRTIKSDARGGHGGAGSNGPQIWVVQETQYKEEPVSPESIMYPISDPVSP